MPKSPEIVSEIGKSQESSKEQDLENIEKRDNPPTPEEVILVYKEVEKNCDEIRGFKKYLEELLFDDMVEPAYLNLHLLDLLFSCKTEKELEDFSSLIGALKVACEEKEEVLQMEHDKAWERVEVAFSGKKPFQVPEEERKQIFDIPIKEAEKEGEKIMENKASDLRRGLQSVLKDSRIFEIGGGNEYIKKLSVVDYTYYNAEGYETEHWGTSSEDSTISKTINTNNCDAILDAVDSNHIEHSFDVTTSKYVFDLGSGVEQTVEPHDHKEGAKEVLRVLNKITKLGGYGVHQLTAGNYQIFFHESEEEDRNLLQDLGFEVVAVINKDERHGSWLNQNDKKIDYHPVLILRKIER